MGGSKDRGGQEMKAVLPTQGLLVSFMGRDEKLTGSFFQSKCLCPDC